MSFAYAIQTSNPWPSLDRAMCYGQACAIEWFNALLQRERPRRAYPAAAYAPKPAPAPVLRIDTSKLPVMHVKFWHEEQRREQERFQEEVHQLLAEAHPNAFADAPFPSDTPTRKQRLYNWLDAHRGALKPWGRKKKPAPVKERLTQCTGCGEVISLDQVWFSNEIGKVLCGKCCLREERFLL